MDRFSKYNPKTNLLFFLLAVVITLMIFNPVFLALSFLFAFLYKLKLNPRGALRALCVALPLLALTSLFNMIFAHYGQTVLFEIGYTVFTLEALSYGFTQGLMVCAVLFWFSCYNEIVSGEMLLSVFGGFMPNISLVFSMALTFIPRLKKNAERINEARTLIKEDGGRLTKAVSNLSALVMMTLEESIDVSDSMRARGFNGKRTSYSKYLFSYKDALLIITELALFFAAAFFKLTGKADFSADPVIHFGEISATGITAYSLLLLLPLSVNLTEDIRWNLLKRKI